MVAEKESRPQFPGYAGFINDGDPPSRMHGHAYAILFLSQVLGSVDTPKKDREIRGVVERGVAVILKSQTVRGGWDYLPGKKRPPRERTIRFYESLFRCHVTPRLGKKRVDEIDAAEIDDLHRSMAATPYMANRVLTVLQHAFDQAPGHVGPRRESRDRGG